MRDETVFFSNDVEPRSARLLFPPTAILSVKAADDSVSYEEGRDYSVDLATATIRLTEGSRIPCTTLYGDVINHGSWKDSQDRFILWGEADFMHKLQVKVSYEHSGEAWDGKAFLPVPKTGILTKVTGKLSANQTCSVVLTGDSISEGYNASGFVGAEPGLPAYGPQVFERLEQGTGSAISFANISKAGQTSPWGLKQLDAINSHNPDLVIIAFGMNDAGKLNHQAKSERYEESIRGIIDGVRAENPEAEFILVTNMLPNPEFKPHDGHWMNRDRLLKIAADTKGVAIADVMKVTEAMLKRKKFADISGNNLNRPNDFLHRVYAEVILGVMGF